MNSVEMVPMAKVSCLNHKGEPMIPPSSERFDELVADIRKHGMKSPIFVDNLMRVVTGHYRYLACKELRTLKNLECAEVPVVVVKTVAECGDWLVDNKPLGSTR